jgi:endonuclease/exonuclease/phosphatase (EEP) superfamily protein YafD
MDAPTQEARLDSPASSPAGEPSPTVWRQRLVRILLVFGWTSTVLHVWPKDRSIGLSTWYYATPWGVILGLGLASAVGCLLLRQPHRSKFASYASLALVMTAGISWLLTDWGWNSSRPETARDSDRPIRLMVWNISSGKAGWRNIANVIQREDPDVICLVEAGPSNKTMRALWTELFPEHHVSMLGGSTVCLVRGASGECTPVELTYKSRLRMLPVVVRGQSFLCAIVDIESSIYNSRETPLSRLASELETASGPMVVAGDFNTPLDSVHLEPLDDHFTSAFREIGSGYGATWPMPLPVLTLDQVWYNDRIDPDELQIGWSSVSDHRPVIFEFTVNE